MCSVRKAQSCFPFGATAVPHTAGDLLCRDAENRTRTTCSQSTRTTTIRHPDKTNLPTQAYYQYTRPYISGVCQSLVHRACEPAHCNTIANIFCTLRISPQKSQLGFLWRVTRLSRYGVLILIPHKEILAQFRLQFPRP